MKIIQLITVLSKGNPDPIIHSINFINLINNPRSESMSASTISSTGPTSLASPTGPKLPLAGKTALVTGADIVADGGLTA